MKKTLSKSHWVSITIFLVLIIDQVIKVWVKTSMYLHESIHITDWFYIYFIENNGMAFGMEIFGKLFLTIFRIIVVGFLGCYLVRVSKRNFKVGYVICLSLIVAGALGNIIDSVFYGVLFEESTYSQIASLNPASGYESLFYGKVVDMFYFPIIDTSWPEWIPWIGGNRFVFFSPIFNFADASITCGVIALLLFYSKCLSESYHAKHFKEKNRGK